MKVIMLAAEGERGEDCIPIGSYTLEGLAKYLNYHLNEAQTDNDWLGRELMVFVMKCDTNFAMWSNEWGSGDCTMRIMCIRNDQGKYGWGLQEREYTCEELVEEIKRFMVDDDDKVKRLEAEIDKYQKRIEELENNIKYLENHIKYMPDGKGAVDAKEHFYSIAEGN